MKTALIPLGRKHWARDSLVQFISPIHVYLLLRRWCMKESTTDKKIKYHKTVMAFNTINWSKIKDSKERTNHENTHRLALAWARWLLSLRRQEANRGMGTLCITSWTNISQKICFKKRIVLENGWIPGKVPPRSTGRKNKNQPKTKMNDHIGIWTIVTKLQRQKGLPWRYQGQNLCPII